jgi:3-isopropylmalate/(R)-2-methylmalate dehydratase large subunit
MRPLVERILADHLGHDVAPGDWVTPQVDRIMVHDGTGPTMARALERHGITDLTAVDRLVVVFDHYFPPTGPREAALHAEARVFCRTHDVPLYEGQGIAHQLLPERGLVGPGQVYVGADSHTCTAGALGALAIGLGATDVAAVVASGRVWMEVPETLQVRLVGALPGGTSAHDLVLEIVGRIGSDGAAGRALEFVGPALAGLSMDDRLKLANFGIEMGAFVTLIGVDAHSLEWMKGRGTDCSRVGAVELDTVGADAQVELDLGAVRLSVAMDPSPDKRRDLDQVEPLQVDQVFIGSCAGGRLSDLAAAATVLEAYGGVRKGVRLLVGPASLEVHKLARESGVLGRLEAMGAVVLPTGCGACMGKIGALAAGEVAVSTQNRNFVGRVGSPEARILLASPEIAAATAALGRLPEEAPCK